jgi:rhomboid protease GluP
MSQGYSSSGQDPYYPPPPAGRVPVYVRPPAAQPVVTYALIGLTVVVFVAQWALRVVIGYDFLVDMGAKNNEMIQQGEFGRFFTPMLLHGSIYHLGFNMYALFAIGRQLEQFYGHGRYLALYVISGFAGNVFSFMFTESWSVGASTAIFGLLAAEGVLLYQNRRMFGPSANRALTQVIMIAVFNLVIGMSPGIDNFGHIGGLIGGALFAWFGGPRLDVTGFEPYYSMVDSHSQRSALLAGLGVSALFALLAAVTMFIRLY